MINPFLRGNSVITKNVSFGAKNLCGVYLRLVGISGEYSLPHVGVNGQRRCFSTRRLISSRKELTHFRGILSLSLRTPAVTMSRRSSDTSLAQGK